MQLEIGAICDCKIVSFETDLVNALSNCMTSDEDSNGNRKVVLEVLADLQCLEEISSKIYLRVRCTLDKSHAWLASHRFLTTALID